MDLRLGVHRRVLLARGKLPLGTSRLREKVLRRDCFPLVVGNLHARLLELDERLPEGVAREGSSDEPLYVRRSLVHRKRTRGFGARLHLLQLGRGGDEVYPYRGAADLHHADGTGIRFIGDDGHAYLAPLPSAEEHPQTGGQCGNQYHRQQNSDNCTNHNSCFLKKVIKTLRKDNCLFALTTNNIHYSYKKLTS